MQVRFVEEEDEEEDEDEDEEEEEEEQEQAKKKKKKLSKVALLKRLNAIGRCEQDFAWNVRARASLHCSCKPHAVFRLRRHCFRLHLHLHLLLLLLLLLLLNLPLQLPLPLPLPLLLLLPPLLLPLMNL